tara:strand:- start:1011 stop:1187 length:177 start_codon:yes stop_codon:yes gene_type:complete
MKMENGKILCDVCRVLVFERNIQWQDNDKPFCLSCADNVRAVLLEEIDTWNLLNKDTK